MSATANAKVAVLALGGNAIIRHGEQGTIAQQFANTRKIMTGAAALIEDGYGLIVTHGNGPQVGYELMRVELAAGKVPELPLGVLVADTEGGMGYMIQQSLQNMLWKRNIKKPVVTLVTQVLVDPADPQLKNPTKPVGAFFNQHDAELLAKAKGWQMREDAGRGWRRVVPSPRPLKIVEHKTIDLLVHSGIIVIAGGGGGIPVMLMPNGDFEGVDAVIDKDFTAALLATAANADLLVITTGVDQVAVYYGAPKQQWLDTLTAAEAQHFFDEGHFPPGSMGPKIQAALWYLRSGGKKVIITSPDRVSDAVRGRGGTVITA